MTGRASAWSLVGELERRQATQMRMRLPTCAGATYRSRISRTAGLAALLALLAPASPGAPDTAPVVTAVRPEVPRLVAGAEPLKLLIEGRGLAAVSDVRLQTSEGAAAGRPVDARLHRLPLDDCPPDGRITPVCLELLIRAGPGTAGSYRVKLIWSGGETDLGIALTIVDPEPPGAIRPRGAAPLEVFPPSTPGERVERARATIAGLSRRAAPAGLEGAPRAAWERLNDWLLTVEARLIVLQREVAPQVTPEARARRELQRMRTTLLEEARQHRPGSEQDQRRLDSALAAIEELADEPPGPRENA